MLGAALCVADHALRGRPYQGQVAEFSEVVHFRDTWKAADVPKLAREATLEQKDVG